jgi:alkyl hydroperoxide reductase subunit AhpC
MEQLNLFAPAAERFKSLGIDLVAISTDTPEGLRKTLMADGKGSPFPFPIVSDAKLDTFKRYRCYDDFEKTALHGSFLIDADGLIRWHDISYQPFTEIDFLVDESRRLLSQGMKAGSTGRSAKGTTGEPADSRPSILQD